MKTVSLYQQILGADFTLLPPSLQRFHALQGTHVLSGWVEIEAPETPVARMLARCIGAPLHAQPGPLHFEIMAEPTKETWTRRFPTMTMRSHLTQVDGHIVERLGFARLRLALKAGPEFLEMKLVGLHFLGVPCPRWLLPIIIAEESSMQGRLHFRVRASLPLVGVVASYQGHLEIPQGGGE